MSNEVAPTASAEALIRRRLITEVLDTIKSGKEASVYRCRAHPALGARWLALKIHRPIEVRAFRNDAVYQQGRVIRKGRLARAYAAGSAFGLRVQSRLWVGAEWNTLRLLHAAGVAVPRPIACEERAILMEWLGDDDPAPPLHRVRLAPEEAERCRDGLLEQIALCLSLNRVHGDLSAFNVLWHDGRPVLIDFPQAVDPRENPQARELLERDLGNLADHFARYGLSLPAARLAAEWWGRWERGLPP
jgi:RIO kinase 1